MTTQESLKKDALLFPSAQVQKYLKKSRRGSLTRTIEHLLLTNVQVTRYTFNT